MASLQTSSPRTALPENSNGLLGAFYGDDFTGSTDVMESLVRSGLSCTLYLELPDSLEDHADESVDVIGLAGLSRSWSVEEMDERLPAIFSRMRNLGAPFFHYKLCSTFDSAPHIGSIGRALEIARSVFGTQPVPLVVGAPILKRYTAFGNLFATVDQTTYRIDRHPTMAYHPVTPMTESDLRVHLSHQSALAGELIDVLTLNRSDEDVDSAVDAVVDHYPGYILFDVLDAESQRQTGRQLARLINSRWRDDGDTTVLFGSSGVEYALATLWEQSTRPETAPAVPVILPPLPTLVVVGSRSPATERQSAFAREHGFLEVAVNPARFLAEDAEKGAYRAELVNRISEGLRSDMNVIVTTPPKDPAVPISGNALASELSDLTKDVCATVLPGRLIVAGGDTSGHIARALGISSLRVISLLTPGAPLCEARFAGDPGRSLQVCLKGGQVGPADYFVQLAGSLLEDHNTPQERAMQ